MTITKEKTLSLRGLCALSVLCSHLISNLNIGTDYKIVNLVSGMMGYIPVTIFFFLSGYGLMMSYTLNGDKYIKEFPRHRLFPYYVKYLIVATIYLLFRIIFSESITPKMLLKSVLFGGTIVKFGWYFQTQLLLYIFFYLSFRFLTNRKKQLLVLSIIIVVFWCVCILTKLDETFFITTPSFLLGIFWTTIVKNVKQNWLKSGGGIPICVYPHLVAGNTI